MKHYAPSASAQDSEKQSEALLTIFRATLAEYGIKLSDLAGGTTDGGSELEDTCANTLLEMHNIGWDRCDCRLADKAAEHAFGTSAHPRKSKHKDAGDVIKLVIKTAAKINQSGALKHKFDKAELEMLDETLNITEHAPERWMTLAHVM